MPTCDLSVQEYAAKAAEMTASWRRATGKRKGGAYWEDGFWCAMGADGHVWWLVDGEWQIYTDADDWYALEVAREKRQRRSLSA